MVGTFPIYSCFMSDGPRGRNWCFTAFDAAESRFGAHVWAQGVLERLHGRCGGYVVGQLEKCPDTHREHIQGFVQLPERKRFQQVQGLCPTGCHLELAQSPKHAVAYCKKVGTRVAGPWEYGAAPVFQGNRTDLSRLHSQLVDNDRDTFDLLLDPVFGPTTMRYFKNCQHVRRALMKRQRRSALSARISSTLSPLIPPLCLWMIGPTGIRKTSTILTRHGVEVYTPATTKDGDSLWFDNYDGETVLLLDEFHPRQMPVSTFLRLTGGDPTLQLPVKGDSTFVQFKYVYIVQNTHTPYDCDSMVAAAIERRITFVAVRNMIQVGFELDRFLPDNDASD